MTRPGLNVLALLKPDGERYVFLYDDESIEELYETLTDYSADKELSFDWQDAATLIQRARALAEQRRFLENGL